MNDYSKIKRNQRLQWLIILALIFYIAYDKTNSNVLPEVIHAKGIVLHDDDGKDRIVMGFPIPQTADRERTDPLSGMIMLSFGC